MAQPEGSDIRWYAREVLWKEVLKNETPPRLNAREGFASFLVGKGVPKLVAYEFAERNVTNLIGEIVQGCEEWDTLGVPRLLDVVNQTGTIVTWAHEKFGAVTGRDAPPAQFVSLWPWVDSLVERDFLFCCAAYLTKAGCGKVFVTDTTGDGGADLIGIIARGPLRGICIVLQAKTAQSRVERDSLYSEYTKFLLLRHSAKWPDYLKALGADAPNDGLGVVYVFASNKEFRTPLRNAARDLPVILRSGRQIAFELSLSAGLTSWKARQQQIGPLDANLSKNLAPMIADLL